MKATIYKILTQPYIVILVMLIAPVLNYFDRNFSFFFGLTIVGLILWTSNYNWSLFGLSKKLDKNTLFKSLKITAILILITYTIDPIIEYYFGKTDISSLEDIKGNFISYVITLILVWVFAGFGEELLFRGYYMKSLAKLFGNTKNSWIISGIVTSIYFGISHYYQGTSGIIGCALWSLLVSYIFCKNKENLMLLVLIHGFYDTVGLTFLYFGI